MTIKRPYYATKSEWATATATRLRGEAATIQMQRIPAANWRAVRSEMTALSTLTADAIRYERLAAKYAEQDL